MQVSGDGGEIFVWNVSSAAVCDKHLAFVRIKACAEQLAISGIDEQRLQIKWSIKV